MDLPLYGQIAVAAASAGFGAFAEKLVKMVRHGKADKPSPNASRLNLVDAVADINNRITDGFDNLNRRMDKGFTELHEELATHRDEFSELKRQVAGQERILKRHDSEIGTIDGRVVTLEEWRKEAAGRR